MAAKLTKVHVKTLSIANTCARALKVNNGGSEKICFLAEGGSRTAINKNLGDICDMNNIIPHIPYDLTMKKLSV